MTCVAELNGETPIEGAFTDDLVNKLEQDDSDDDTDSTSNIYESVRDVVLLPRQQLTGFLVNV